MSEVTHLAKRDFTDVPMVMERAPYPNVAGSESPSTVKTPF